MEDKVEVNHTHCILFDNGRLNERLGDLQRDKFVTAVCNDIGPTCTYLDYISGTDNLTN